MVNLKVNKLPPVGVKMSRMTKRNLKQGDIVLVQFPFSSFKRDKKRLALVISSDWYNEYREDVILLPIVSSKVLPQPKRDDYKLSQTDLNFARLDKPFVVKLGKIMTVKKSCVLRLIKKRRLPLGTVKNIIYILSNDILAIS